MTTTATPQLQSRVRRELDHLWQTAPNHYRLPLHIGRHVVESIRTKARYRVHAWLCEQLGLPGSYCRVADLDDEQCREALRLIESTSYPRIREWAKEQG